MSNAFSARAVSVPQPSPEQAAVEPSLETKLAELIGGIPQPDAGAMDAARQRQAQLTKPGGALGRLETLSIQLAGITGQAVPRLYHKAIVVAAADHGVCAEGVSPYPQAVTAQMVANFLAGGAAINVLARQVGARVTVLDLGVAFPIPGVEAAPATARETETEGVRLLSRPMGPGTANMAMGPAMSPQQAMEAIWLGVETVEQEARLGLHVLGLGEMGIGNTTAAAAIACALSGIEPARMVGRGAGLDDAGLRHKIEVVGRALAVNGLQSAPGATVERPQTGQTARAIAVLAGVGGFEVAGLTGAILAAAARRIPVVIDGYIATSAAMLAATLAPQVVPYFIPAHRSAEPGHLQMLAWLGLEPYLALDMRLGEGTGAALGMALVDAAWQTMAQMATFGEAGVSDKQ